MFLKYEQELQYDLVVTRYK